MITVIHTCVHYLILTIVIATYENDATTPTKLIKQAERVERKKSTSSAKSHGMEARRKVRKRNKMSESAGLICHASVAAG